MLCCRNSPESFTSFSPQSSPATDLTGSLNVSNSSKCSEQSHPAPIASPYSLAAKNGNVAEEESEISQELSALCDVEPNAPVLEIPRPIAPKQPKCQQEVEERNFNCSSENIVIPSEQKTVRAGSRQSSTLSETKFSNSSLENGPALAPRVTSSFESSAEVSFERIVEKNEQGRTATGRLEEHEVELARIVELGQRNSKAQRSHKEALVLAKK